jgi:phosphate transport system substrate-binding protein
MLVEVVAGRRSMPELQLETVEDDEAFRRLCTSQTADLVVTTRSMTEDEMRQCAATLGFRAERIRVLKLGHMGVVISAAKLGTSSTLSPREVFLALAKRVPDPENPARFIPNTKVSWHQVGAYQERRITFFGPERDSPLAKVFAALILKAGCNTFPSIKALRDTDADEYHRLCREIRDDSVYTPVHEGEFFLTQTLWGDPHAIAVLSLPFFDAHRAELSGSLLSGATPTPEAIASGTYEGAVTLFLHARLDTDAEWLARDFEYALEPPTTLVNYGLILDRGTRKPLSELDR